MKRKPFEPMVVNVVVNVDKEVKGAVERKPVVGYYLTKHFAYTQTYMPEDALYKRQPTWNITHIQTGMIAGNMVGDRSRALRMAIMFETLGVHEDKSLWDFTEIEKEKGCPIEEIRKIGERARWIMDNGLI